MPTPPRRRRTEPHRPDGSGWLPTIAMGLAVIVAGLGIGALIAVFMQRHSAAAPVAFGTPAATASVPVVATLAPVALATTPPVSPHPVQRTSTPTRAQTPTPLPSPAPTSSAAPNATPLAIPTPVASLSPQATHTAGAVPSPDSRATAVSSRVVLSTPAIRPTRPPAAEPSATPNAATAAPVVTATPALVSVTSPAAEPSSYEQHASAVVRRYIDALIRGDQQTAYLALGQSTGGTGSLPEQAFLDAGAHIVSLKVTRIDAANATVGCEMAASKGHYYGTYHVTAGAGGAYIAEHDYIKV